MRKVSLTIAGIVLSAGLVGAQSPDPKKVEAGKQIYTTQKCSECHAIAGKGGKLSKPLDGVAGKVSEADIRKWLTDASTMESKLEKKPKMPMSKYLKTHKLTDADVDALTAYMLSLK